MLFNFVELSAFSELLRENGYRKVCCCKNCKYSIFDKAGKTGHCFLRGAGVLVRAEDFCSKGENADGKEV